jgi:hypothetical protein
MDIILKLLLTLCVLFGINGALTVVYKKCYTSDNNENDAYIRQTISETFTPIVDRLVILLILIFVIAYSVYSTMPVVFTAIPAAYGYISEAFGVIKDGMSVILTGVNSVKSLIP